VDDAALVAGLGAGEPGAVREFYSRYAGPVFTVAVSVLDDRQLAEDVVQVTFVKAWRAAGTFDGTRPLAPWLYVVARHVAIDLYRKTWRTRPGPLAMSATSPPPSFEHAWERREIQVALDALSRQERQIVLAQHYLGLSHGQIADGLRLPVGTVKSRSHRAHRKLASRLRHLASPATA